MKGLKRSLVLFIHITIIIRAHARESCHVNDAWCNAEEKSPLFIKNDQDSESWTDILWDQVNNIKTTVLGASYPDTPKYGNNMEGAGFDSLFGMNDEDMMKYAQNLASSFLDGEQLEMFQEYAAGVLSDDQNDIEVDDKDGYEYPPVEKVKSHEVGHVQYLELEDGVKTKLITRSTNPPLFEIPSFLTPSECDLIIEKSKEKGLNESTMFQTKERIEAGINKGIERVSYSSFLTGKDIDRDFLNKLHDKVAKLLDIPKEVVQWSEHMVIGMYKPGGHYYAHLDSTEAKRNKPCCFQKVCYDSNNKESDNLDCCRMCRFATVLYYLSDVEEGGETAFPMADLPFSEISKKETTDWRNLTANCYDASVIVKPEKGKAILWYNHIVDKNGYIDSVDKRSYHGGCDVIKGQKWIATNWISTPLYRHRLVPSKYKEKFNEYMGKEDAEQIRPE